MQAIAAISLRGLVLAAGVVAFLPADAAHFYVNGSQGTNRLECITAPGTGAAACRTISYVVSNAALRGGDVVHVAAGEYREMVEIGSADSGASDTSRVLFTTDGAAVRVTPLDVNALDDAQFVACSAAANCAGDGLAYPNTYRISATGRTIRQVWETAWQPFVVDDTAGSSHAAWNVTKPYPYTAETSVARVSQVACSYLVSGGNLFVHTCHNEVPSVAGTDLETSNAAYGFSINGANWITLDGFTVSYFDTGVLVNNADGVILRNMNIHSGTGAGVLFIGSSDYGQFLNSEISHITTRGNYSTPCAATCGWVSNASGSALKVDGSNMPNTVGITGYTLSGLVAYNSWNVINLEDVNNSVFEDILAKNTPNHAFIMTGDVTDCHSNILRRNTIFNAQDDFYIAGCVNSRAIRNAATIGLQTATAYTGSSHGWRHFSNLSTGIADPNHSIDWGTNVSSDATPGFVSDYNWMQNATPRCGWAGTYYQCGTTWKNACNCDRNNQGGSVLMANIAWPYTPGLAISGKVKSDFYPVLGSAVIDRGNPDLDGDGVLENGPGGDDECVPRNHCFGAGPDIGPYEYGIDTPAEGGGGDPPVAPSNARRTDQR